MKMNEKQLLTDMLIAEHRKKCCWILGKILNNIIAILCEILKIFHNLKRIAFIHS